MYSQYLPVDPDFQEIIQKEKDRKSNAVVNYFDPNGEVEDVKNEMKEVVKSENGEEHLLFANGEKVRLDRIITINGKPGPAYDEYDSYALQCLDCKGGMDV